MINNRLNSELAQTLQSLTENYKSQISSMKQEICHLQETQSKLKVSFK